MATDRYPVWAAEQAGTHRLPTIWSAFLLFGLLAALAPACSRPPPRPRTVASGRRGRCAPSTAPILPGGRSAPRPGAAEAVRLLSVCCP